MFQGRCAEDHLVRGAACSEADNRCVEGQYLNKGHGTMTGQLEFCFGCQPPIYQSFKIAFQPTNFFII